MTMSKFKHIFVKIKDRIGWKMLDSYILKKFLSSFLLSIVLLMTIVVVFDLSDNLSRFLSNNAPLKAIITERYFNFIPIFANLFTNLFTFISVIWFTSKLSNQNEIISIFNGGVSFNRFMFPYLTGALIIAFASFSLSNFYIPQANKQLNTFNEKYLNRKKDFSRFDIHIKVDENTYVYMERWKKTSLKGENFTYEKLGRLFTTYKLKASEIQYNKEQDNWTLYNYVIRTISPNGTERIRSGDRMDTVFNFKHTEFSKTIATAETMSFRALRKFIKEEKEKGSSLVKYYEIEKHKRMTTPFGTIIMALLGLSVASRKTQRGVGVHIFVGLTLSFLFIFFQQVSDTFAVSGNLSPLIASWLPNGIYLVICIIMIRFAQK